MFDDEDIEEFDEMNPRRRRKRYHVPVSKAEPTEGSQVYRFAWRFSFSEKLFPLGTPLDTALTKFKALPDEFKKVFGNAKYIFQLECTKTEQGRDNWHYQGYLKLPDKKRPMTLGKELGSVFPGIWVAPACTVGDEALKSYCMKRDETYRAGPWADREISAPYDGDEFKGKLRPWHRSIVEHLSKKPHSRRIYWINDQGGGVGKSHLVKYMEYKKIGTVLTFDTAANLCFQVTREGPRKAYFFDLPRNKSKFLTMDEIYCALENVKNGLVKSNKGMKAATLLMARPHVFVFSNYMPERNRLSEGRIRIMEIRKDTMEFVTCLDPDELPEEEPDWDAKIAAGNRKQFEATASPNKSGAEGAPAAACADACGSTASREGCEECGALAPPATPDGGWGVEPDG